MSEHEQQQFVKQVRQRLDASLQELDGPTLARLRAARRQALEQRRARPVWVNRMALATAMSCVLTLGVWWVQRPVVPDLPMEDLAVLTATDDLELYRDLEFYQWLEYHGEQG